MKIVEVFENGIETIADNKSLIIGVGAIAIVGYLLLTKNNSDNSSEMVSIQGAYASYPDAVTNADEIIDTTNKEINNSADNIIGYINDKFDSLSNEITTIKDDVAENKEVISGIDEKIEKSENLSLDDIEYIVNDAVYNNDRYLYNQMIKGGS